MSKNIAKRISEPGDSRVRYGTVELSGSGQGPGDGPGKQGGKMILTMAQLKNCCLGGLKAGTEREGKQRSHQ